MFYKELRFWKLRVFTTICILSNLHVDHAGKEIPSSVFFTIFSIGSEILPFVSLEVMQYALLVVTSSINLFEHKVFLFPFWLNQAKRETTLCLIDTGKINQMIDLI